MFFTLVFTIDELYRNILSTKDYFKGKNLQLLPFFQCLSYLKIILGAGVSFFCLKDLINEKEYKKMIFKINSKEEIEKENIINNQIIEKIIYEGESIILQKNKNKNNYL